MLRYCVVVCLCLAGVLHARLLRIEVPERSDVLAGKPFGIQNAYRVDYGAGEPPMVEKPLTMLVPQVNADGNETSGVRMPAVEVPIATYTGWNLRSPAIGAPDELYSMAGSWIPFHPKVIQPRYPSRAFYLRKIEAAARTLVAGGYLLERDIPKIVERSGEEWDYVRSLSR
jgi:Alpha/beta hydrolase domain